MYCNTCETDPCRCTAETPPAQTPPPRAYQPAPSYDYTHAISLDEFGPTLFACINAFAGRNYAREMYRYTLTCDLSMTPAERRRRLDAWTAREAMSEREAKRLIDQLGPADQRDVLARFETPPTPPE